MHLSDNPLDASKVRCITNLANNTTEICFLKLLIGYESGQIVLWDLKIKSADVRCQTTEPLRSIAWHYEGKQFMCSHKDGSLTTWYLKQPTKPIHISQPHGIFL